MFWRSVRGCLDYQGAWRHWKPEFSASAVLVYLSPQERDMVLPLRMRAVWARGPSLRCFLWQCFYVTGDASGKELPASVGDVRDASSIPGSGRSPGEGNGNPLQHSCLENSMDRGAWQATVWVTKSWTWLKWLSPPTPYKSKDWLQRREESLPNSFPRKVPWEQKHKSENWSDWRSKPRPPLTVRCACVLSCSLSCVQLFATP